MTTQEFVKQEAQKHLEKVPNGMVNAPLLERSFATGLTKGLEIAKEAILFIANCTEETANEIVQKVITEKYGK